MTEQDRGKDAADYIRKAESGMPHDTVALAIIKRLSAWVQELERDLAAANVREADARRDHHRCLERVAAWRADNEIHVEAWRKAEALVQGWESSRQQIDERLKGCEIHDAVCREHDEIQRFAWWHRVADTITRYRARVQALERELAALKAGDAKVTRFEVIDHSGHNTRVGRAFTAYGVQIVRSYQDGGRTLKVFVDDAPPAQEPQG